MIELPTLYPHQEESLARLKASLAKHRSVAFCASPGFGKTILSKWILGKAASLPPSPNKSGNVLFAVHRRGLVDNAIKSFNGSPSIPHGVIMSGRDTTGGAPIQIGSIDTLISWYCEDGTLKWPQTFDMLVFDECHSRHSRLMTYLKCHNKKREELGLHQPYVIGLSATPQAEGLSDLYKEIVFGPSTQWLIDNKYLSPFRYFSATTGDLKKLVKSGDEFTEGSVCEAMSGLSGMLVRDWKRYAEGRATVGFFPRRMHAKEAMEELTANGVRCEYVDGNTPDADRNAMFSRLNDGDIDYICNVGVIERGTDIPRIGCVQMCTAIGSVVRWLQMVGRGSRIHPDVSDCIVIDHGGNVARHGFFEDEIHWTLDWTKRPAKDHVAKPTIECPSCGAMYRGGKCIKCGYEPTRKQRLDQGLVFDGVELKEVKEKKKRGEGKSQTPEQIMASAIYAAGKSGKTFKQALAIAYRNAKEAGVTFSVPKYFTVAGQRFSTIPRGSEDSGRKVRDTYPFTVGDYSQASNPYFVCTVDTPSTST